jgi:hypothetical protein
MDLVSIEIIFGHLFEAFQCTSLVVGADHHPVVIPSH